MLSQAGRKCEKHVPDETMSQPSERQQNVDDLSEGHYPRAAPIMVWITLLLFIVIMVLLGYRWLNMAEPNGFIVVQGSDAFAGAEVSVTDATGDIATTSHLTATNNYMLRFPLPQGNYQLTVKMDDKIVMKQPIILREAAGVVWALDKNLLPATQVATPGD